MVDLGQIYDPEGVEAPRSFEPIPPGWYVAQAVHSDVQQSRSGRGSYLLIEWEIDGDRHPDVGRRRMFVRLNLWNDNPTAVDIAQRDLAAIQRALALGPIRDSEQMHLRPIAIKVRTRAASEQYEAQSEVCGYDSVGNRFSAPAPTSTKPAPAANSGGQPALKPWERGK
jgi:hypothetical protein